MFGYPQNEFMFILLPTLSILVLSYVDFILTKKTYSLSGISIWGLDVFLYYSILVVITIYLNLPTNLLYWYCGIGPNGVILVCILSLSQLFIYSIFFKIVKLMYPILLISLVVFLPALYSADFTIFFICVESVTIILGIVFITKCKSESSNNALLSLVISNSITFLMFSVSISSMYMYYGTTNLYIICILFNYSFLDYLVIFITSLSIMCKLGQFPIFFYNIGVYNGLNTPYLGLYTIVYTNIIYIPCIIILKTIILLLYTSVPSLFFIFTITVVMLLSYFSDNTKDFLFISTALYTPLFFLL